MVFEAKEISIGGKEILSAYAHLREIFDSTPTIPYASFLAEGHNIDVLAKCEHVGSMRTFKVRGAEIAVSETARSLLGEGKDLSNLEMVTASAGNHAQGVALAASRWKVPATIYIPTTTPEPKIRRLQETIAYAPEDMIKIVKSGNNFNEALEASLEYKSETDDRRLGLGQKRVFVPPYQNKNVIRGQGSVLAEFMVTHANGVSDRQALRFLRGDDKLDYAPEFFYAPDVVIAGLGGGGLVSGLGALAKYLNTALGTNIKVVGVQSEFADSMHRSYHAGQLLPSSREGATIADGIAVRSASQQMLNLVRANVDDVILVSEEEIENAIRTLHYNPRFNGKKFSTLEWFSPLYPARTLPGNTTSFFKPRYLDRIEGAAGAALAGISHLDYKKLGLGDKEHITVLAVLSGGNIDYEKFDKIVGRPGRTAG